MNKKVIITIVAIVIVIAVAATVVFFALTNNKNVTLDLAAINTEIINNSGFGEMMTMDLDKEALETLMEIPQDQVEEVIGKVPMINVQASMYVIIKATEGNVDAVKEKVEAYGNAQEQIWERYLPEQYEYVMNRKIGVKGNYVYMIIAENVEQLESLIK